MESGLRYHFRDSHVERLLQLCGRRDSAAMHLVDDLERSVGAYAAAQGRGWHGGVPEPIARDLMRVSELASGLRQALYALPGEVTQLIELQLASEAVRSRIGQDLGQLAPPLEDLVAAIAELKRSAVASGAGAGAEAPLLRAMALSYRNRLNLPASGEPGGHFARFIRGLLEIAAEDTPGLRPLLERLTTRDIARLAGGGLESGIEGAQVQHDPWDPPVKGIGE